MFSDDIDYTAVEAELVADWGLDVPIARGLVDTGVDQLPRLDPDFAEESINQRFLSLVRGLALDHVGNQIQPEFIERFREWKLPELDIATIWQQGLARARVLAESPEFCHHPDLGDWLAAR